MILKEGRFRDILTWKSPNSFFLFKEKYPSTYVYRYIKYNFSLSLLEYVDSSTEEFFRSIFSFRSIVRAFSFIVVGEICDGMDEQVRHYRSDSS